ncbi:unnamed protein product, partial [Coregonus sp. 'balchen']
WTGRGQRNKRSRLTCELCDKVIIGYLEWTGKRRSLNQNLNQLVSSPRGTTPPPTPTTEGLTLGNPTSLAPGSAEACGEPEYSGTNYLRKKPQFYRRR